MNMNMKKEETITMEDLWHNLVSQGYEPHMHNGYEVIDCSNIEVLTYGKKYVNLIWLSRHKTPKHLVRIEVESCTRKSENMHDIVKNSVIVTTDHICMKYNKDHFFENVNAKDLYKNDYVSVYDPYEMKEHVGTIVNIEDLGITDEWVYDVEVDDDMHSFYANDILVHNSQFINLQCISDYLKKKRNLPKNIRDWTIKDKKLFWKLVRQFVDKEVNPYVRQLVHDYCKTTQQNVLTYELEYMSDVGIYESMKHYATHKIFDEGELVDKIKYAGIELKKAQVPKEMKTFLAEIYDGVINKDWDEINYKQYIDNLYTNFRQYNIDQISFWKGYNTERQAVGFLEMTLGTTGIAKACTYYNQIIAKLGLNKKYEEIRVGDKVRFCYVEPGNEYGINQIAYKPGQWPKEFDNIFKVDYKKMFNKIILDPLKRFRIACKFEDTDPSKQAVFDVFSL